MTTTGVGSQPGPAQSAGTHAAPAQPGFAPAPSSNPNQRLVIQETGEVGVFVYTVLDWTTGQVVTQLPCETVLNLARQPEYAAGQIVSTTA